MDYSFHIEPRKQLSFCEAHILMENVNLSTTQGSFIARLDFLLKHTEDIRLLTELDNLLSKVKELTPTEFAQLKQDTLQRKIAFPPDYCMGSFP